MTTLDGIDTRQVLTGWSLIDGTDGFEVDNDMHDDPILVGPCTSNCSKVEMVVALAEQSGELERRLMPTRIHFSPPTGNVNSSVRTFLTPDSVNTPGSSHHWSS